MPRSRVTIRDVAARAGVSHQTVSRVINKSEQVTPETRERVKLAIKELGYRPSRLAQSMVTQKRKERLRITAFNGKLNARFKIITRVV